jgi:hypothetical protein
VRWYLRYKLSYRDLVEMMAERGLALSHTTTLRWVRTSCLRDTVWYDADLLSPVYGRTGPAGFAAEVSQECFLPMLMYALETPLPLRCLPADEQTSLNVTAPMQQGRRRR